MKRQNRMKKETELEKCLGNMKTIPKQTLQTFQDIEQDERGNPFEMFDSLVGLLDSQSKRKRMGDT